MVGVAMIRTQGLHETATRLLRMPIMERHGGVDRDQLIKRIQRYRNLWVPRGNKISFFEKIKGIVYSRFEDPRRNIRMKQAV
ncbi:hypothetical protein PoB_004308700 [Plakobranchus ocellatus]|uniref:Uncharacterized protein n=1 Tax=Plakobranchus ocellatus TaxID=259542 RepID=A0AAV4BAY0_9GAST|nr:hypothetical protein PoB_004308700 [Plakobranchus ocellatus]